MENNLQSTSYTNHKKMGIEDLEIPVPWGHVAGNKLE